MNHTGNKFGILCNMFINNILKIYSFFNVFFLGYLIYYSIFIKNTITDNDIPNSLNGYLYDNPDFAIKFFIPSFLGIIAISLVVSMSNSKPKDEMKIKFDTLSLLHNDFIHSLRNNVARLDGLQETLNNENKEENLIRELYNSEHDNMRKSVEKYINSLSDYYLNITGIKIAVCVKIFTLDSYKLPMDDRKLITLARCKHTYRKRKQSNANLAIVGKNTDFKRLCDGAGAYYVETNLREKLKQGLYESDSDSVKNKLYNSTLVAPIRHVNNLSEYTINSVNIIPKVRGFLCIDTKENVEEWKEVENNLAIELLGIFADALYIYLDKFYTLFEGRVKTN